MTVAQCSEGGDSKGNTDAIFQGVGATVDFVLGSHPSNCVIERLVSTGVHPVIELL